MTYGAQWETDWHMAQACLQWQVEIGVDEAICDDPVNRYALEASTPKPPAMPAPAAAPANPSLPLTDIDPVQEAMAAASAAPDLTALEAALAAFAHCDLRKGARNCVFADGQPGARVMIVGEAPGREEDLGGKPFVGEAGQLLDRMFAAIGMQRNHPDPNCALYITNILPWRPPQNRDPSMAERAMFRPFVLRHIELAAPDIVVLMGRISAATVLETGDGITRIRGQWNKVLGRPALPMLHPAYLLRNPAAKREAWADLLELQARIKQTS
jgi:uracil-DNA glycosylase family 4